MRTSSINFLKIILIVLVILPGCSRTKDTWLSRNWHMLASKYNPLFNGNEALIKGVNAIENGHEDDYLNILPIYIWPEEAQVASIESDMERAEEKGVKTIKEHSMVFGRDQKNKYIDDSYLLIGKSRVYRRMWFPALEAFNYIIVEFPQEDLVHEARLWAARTYVLSGNFSGAQEQFDKLYQNTKVPKKLEKEILASYAEMKIKQKEYQKASELLEEAISKRIGKERKVRFRYIQAQLQEEIGNTYEASELYAKVVKMKPPYEFYFAAQMARVRNFDPYLQESAPVYAELRKMAKSDKNYDNRDQIYYAMADISIKEDLIPEAFEYLEKSIRTNTTNQTQLGLSHLRKGELHFDFREYIDAAGHYDSAHQSLPSEHHRYAEVEKKKESLAELVRHLNTIEVEDSLQAMAAMPEKERNKLIQKRIRILEKEKAARERAEAVRGGPVAPGGGGFSMGGQRSGKWYFYDDTQRNDGVTQFSNRWGTRKLEDNWRRKNKTSVSNFVPGEGESEGEGEPTDSTQDPMNPAYYLSRIPFEEDSLDASHGRIINAHEGAGRVYRDVLEDFIEAVDIYEQLMKRYPGADFEPRTLYTLCLMTRETKQAEKNDNYCGKLQSEYGHTPFAQLLDGSLDPDNDAGHDSIAEVFYREAHAAFERNQYKKAKKMCQQGIVDYAETDLLPQLELLLALCIGSEGEMTVFLDELVAITEKYEGDPVAIEAQYIIDYLGGPSDFGSPLSPEVEAMFTYNPNEAHQYVLILPKNSTDFNRIRNTISDFNMKVFSNQRLKSRNIMMGEEKQLVIISGFKQAKSAMDYFEAIQLDPDVQTYLPKTGYDHFVISQSNFKVMYAEEAVYEYDMFFKVKFNSDNF